MFGAYSRNEFYVILSKNLMALSFSCFDSFAKAESTSF